MGKYAWRRFVVASALACRQYHTLLSRHGHGETIRSPEAAVNQAAHNNYQLDGPRWS
jgi:hypothetical protein